MQKQRGAATWMHLMGFDNVKISISTKKSEDLHKVFPEINRYIKSGGGFNFCKETATFIMQFAASPVAGENTKFSIRSIQFEFRSKYKVKYLYYSSFHKAYIFTLLNQDRCWDMHILHFTFSMTVGFPHFKSTEDVVVTATLYCRCRLQSYLVLSKDVSCVQRGFAYTYIQLEGRQNECETVRVAKSKKRFRNI